MHRSLEYEQSVHERIFTHERKIQSEISNSSSVIQNDKTKTRPNKFGAIFPRTVNSCELLRGCSVYYLNHLSTLYVILQIVVQRKSVQLCTRQHGSEIRKLILPSPDYNSRFTELLSYIIKGVPTSFIMVR